MLCSVEKRPDASCPSTGDKGAGNTRRNPSLIPQELSQAARTTNGRNTNSINAPHRSRTLRYKLKEGVEQGKHFRGLSLLVAAVTPPASLQTPSQGGPLEHKPMPRRLCQSLLLPPSPPPNITKKVYQTRLDPDSKKNTTQRQPRVYDFFLS